jgi:hypothetical protein
MRAMSLLLVLSMTVLIPVVASAQAKDDTNLFWDLTKAVVFDPTTYAPATLSYTSMKMDWDSSQTLFRNGWMEQNRRFTVSGRANDLPVSHAEGNKRIRRMALLHLQGSLINNTAANIFERILTERYPQHRNVFKVLSWVERIAFASYMSYAVSANHFRQAQRNRQLAVQYGYR